METHSRENGSALGVLTLLYQSNHKDFVNRAQGFFSYCAYVKRCLLVIPGSHILGVSVKLYERHVLF